MKKILLSLLSISAVAALAVGASTAFFSDEETSTGNTLVAGEIDLQIDNHSYIDQTGNGLVLSEETTWEFNEPMGLFFDFEDLKPGDLGEDTVSIHLTSNPAWLCVDLDITANDDVDCTEPESEDDPACAVNEDLFDGDLAGALNFVFWADDGDNVLEDQEPILTSGPASNVLDGVTWAIADSTVNGGTPLDPGTHFIGKAWCFGELTEARLPQEEGEGPDVRGAGVDCDGSLVDNAAQTDLLMGDISFRAVQSRHNPNFVCDSEAE